MTTLVSFQATTDISFGSSTLDRSATLRLLQNVRVALWTSQTCQGPEMKMRETVRHSGEGAVFSGGGSTACDAAFF